MCLKAKGKSITESLTFSRMEKLKNARDEYGFFSVWAVDGKIMFANSGISTMVKLAEC